MKLSRKFVNDPTPRAERSAWNDLGWLCRDGLWRPIADNDLYERVAVQEMASGQWIALLDSTRLNENDGGPLTWPDKYSAGFVACQAVQNDWHGPARRFDAHQPWTGRHGFLMRPLVGAFITARGRPIDFRTTPVAVIRQRSFFFQLVRFRRQRPAAHAADGWPCSQVHVG